MKRLTIFLALGIAIWAWSPTVNLDTLSLTTSTAHAWSWSDWKSSWREYREARWARWRSRWHDQKGDTKSVPELDAGTAGAAMFLLLGGTAYLVSRRREDTLS